MSPCSSSQLCLSSASDLWPCAMKSLSACESLCFFSALFLISDLLPWNSFQHVSLCASLALSLISNLLPWNSFQLVSPCVSPQLCIWSLTSCYEIPFSVWVLVLLLSFVFDLWLSTVTSHVACESLFLMFESLTSLSSCIQFVPVFPHIPFLPYSVNRAFLQVKIAQSLVVARFKVSS